MRRQHHKLTAPHMVTCPNCRALKVSHRVCMSCGYYAGRQVVDIELRTPRRES
jgi:large subunit ribosomal protein L32